MVVKRKRYDFSLSPDFVQCLQEFVKDERRLLAFTINRRRSVSAMIELVMIQMLIIPDLRSRGITSSKLNRCMNDTALACQLWLALHKAERGEPGYKLFRGRINDGGENEIVAIQGIDENGDPIMY